MFQSTCPRGTRHLKLIPIGSGVVFQSTCPRGTRHQCHHTMLWIVGFNPRAHEGHDVHNSNYTETYIVFQSTCPRGTRLLSNTLLLDLILFQSTCPRGTRLHSISKFRLSICFNPRAHEGHDEHGGN